jgi:DNA-binding protein H-NS
MRKPRDFDAQLKALNEKAKQLKDRKIRQYGCGFRRSRTPIPI